MRLRFRRWGSEDWTFVQVQGDDEDLTAAALSILGAGLRHFHCQLMVDGKWENLGE
jgi:hypothetical protein